MSSYWCNRHTANSHMFVLCKSTSDWHIMLMIIEVVYTVHAQQIVNNEPFSECVI